MATVQDLIDDVTADAAFDVTPDIVLRILDRRHKQMCARARVYRKTAEFGPTVVAQQLYGAGTGLVEARDVTVGGLPYSKGRHTDIAQDVNGWLSLTGLGGIFIETASAAAANQIALIPTPSEAGLAIAVFGVFLPPTLEADNNPGLLTDEDFAEGLLAGVFATLLSRPSEARTDLAAGYEAQFAAACEEQRGRVTRRLRGPGPAHIRMDAGYA